jgi:ABC-2 type transport system ATP-binding protein
MGAQQETDCAVSTTGLRKSFSIGRKRVEAVCGVNLCVGRGEIFGFLGPNGAGKTTTLRMLATLLQIDEGEAIVAGVDVRRRPGDVRRRIGYVGQLGGADLPATGRENLMLQGRLYGASKAETSRRADELIELLALGDFADRSARTYSGGQRRRLEVALGIMHRPDVLFLDEPTTGLDPQNRANLWDQLRALRSTGTTIFLTTHNLEEADALADRVAIIDHGTVVAEGTPLELKRQIGGGMFVVYTGLPPSEMESLRTALAGLEPISEARVDGAAVRLRTDNGRAAMSAIARVLESRNVPLAALSLSEASLGDVFLQQTGRPLRDAGQNITEISR